MILAQGVLPDRQAPTCQAQSQPLAPTVGCTQLGSAMTEASSAVRQREFDSPAAPTEQMVSNNGGS